jgi:hypothetical protein
MPLIRAGVLSLQIGAVDSVGIAQCNFMAHGIIEGPIG